MGGAVPAFVEVGGVEYEAATAVVEPHFVFEDALGQGEETVVDVALGGEDVGEKEGEATEGDGASDRVEAGGAESHHGDDHAVAPPRLCLEMGYGVAPRLADVVDKVFATRPSPTPGGFAVAHAEVFDHEFHTIVGYLVGGDVHGRHDGLYGVDGDGAAGGALSRRGAIVGIEGVVGGDDGVDVHHGFVFVAHKAAVEGVGGPKVVGGARGGVEAVTHIA